MQKKTKNESDLEKKVIDLNEKIKELESKIEDLEDQLETPIPIELVFDLLTEKDAINLVSKLQLKLHNRIKTRIDKLKNEIGLSENNLEVFELNLKNTSLGRVFKK